MQGIFITGTDTGVGKTWFTERLIPKLMSSGLQVHARKPVESGWQEDWRLTDAGRLLQAVNPNGVENPQQALQQICPYRFQAALSPVRAAAMEGQQLSIEDIKQACQIENDRINDVVCVEGAGGFYSPLASDGLNADLAQALGLPVILVAEDRLGCINQVLLCLEAIQNRGLQPLAVFLNQKTIDDPSMDNAEDLRQLTNVPICLQVDDCVPLVSATLQRC